MESDELTSDIGITVYRRFLRDEIEWPTNSKQRIQFLEEYIGKVWDALLYTNIDAAAEWVFEKTDDTTMANRAWEGLGDLLTLVLALEDELDTTITPKSRIDTPEEIASYKSRVRDTIASG